MENNALDTSYPESGNSSPRSRENEYENPPTWEDPQSNYKVKFMCSYGGKIQPRPHDNQLSYIGGDTKILAVDRNIKFDSLLSKAIALCDCVSISLKYQLPGEDLDALISVMNDEDLEHLMSEYDRLYKISPKPVRLRIFIFRSQNPSVNSSSSSSDEVKTEMQRFVEVLNSAPIFARPQQSVPPAPPANNMDYLFGFDKASNEVVAPQPTGDGVQELEDLVMSDQIQKHIQDLERLRIEEHSKRKNDESLSNNKQPEKISQISVPHWKGVGFPVHNEQQFYMMMRPVNGAPTQGYYTTFQRADQIYNMIPQGIVNLPPEGFGAGVISEAAAGYTQVVAYDSSTGRQVIYSAPGGRVMGIPVPVKYQGAVTADMRPPTGALNVGTVVKVAPKPTTQASLV